MTHRYASLLILLLLAAPAAAQPATTGVTPGEGTARAVVAGWPDDAADGEWYARLRRAELVVFVDTLRLDVRWRVEDGRPALEAAVDWTPGAGGILDGERVAYELLPSDARLVALAVEADVTVGGARIGGLTVELDSVRLGPRPEAFTVASGPVAWDALFTDADSAAAWAALAHGFEIGNLRIRSIAFASDAPRDDRRGPYTVVSDPRAPRRVGVYTSEPTVAVDIRLGWLLGRPDRPRGGTERGAYEPRGARIGRTADGSSDRPSRGGRNDRGEDRGEDRGGVTDDSDGDAVEEDAGGASEGLLGRLGRVARGASGDEDRDEDDDEEDETNELLPVGLAAVAAVGVLAYHSGTIGYIGHTRYAPYGVGAGYVRRRGGVMVHAGLTDAVLSGGDGPRHGAAGVVAFGRVIDGPLQPAVGVGVRATDAGDAVEFAPSISMGLAFNRGPIVAVSTYDLAQGGWVLGAAFNFRWGR